jgi:hypothetical protein
MEIEEELEIRLEEAAKLQRFGFMNLKHYEEHKEHASTGLIKFGDGFEIALGIALQHAQMDDSLKILRYWNHRCEQYAILHKIYLAKEKIRNENTAG